MTPADNSADTADISLPAPANRKQRLDYHAFRYKRRTCADNKTANGWFRYRSRLQNRTEEPWCPPAVFGKQTIRAFRNAAQILGNQFHTAGFRQPGQFWDKYVVFGIRAVIPAFAAEPQPVIAYKTNRMVDADNIIQTGIKTKTRQVPAEFVRSGGRPIVARHIPAAGMGGETVSPARPADQGYGRIFRIDGKNISAAPDVGTVVSNVKGKSPIIFMPFRPAYSFN